MNAITILIIIILGTAFALAIRYLIKKGACAGCGQKGAGCSGCAQSSARCSRCPAEKPTPRRNAENKNGAPRPL